MTSQLAFPMEAPRPQLDLAALCSDEERVVARVLRWGREEAQQIPMMAERTGIGDRRLQEVIQHLILDHAVPIGTATSRPFGNYLIDDPEDLMETVMTLRSRGMSSLARAASLRKMSLARYLAEVQLDIETAIAAEARG